MAEGTLLRLRKLAIVENASPDNIVNLTPVTEGPDGASVFGSSNEHDTFQIEAGQLFLDRGNPSLEVVTLKPDSSNVTQIESWVNNQTDVYLVGLTLDGGLFFGDRQTSNGVVKLQANEEVTDNDLYGFGVTKTTPPGFDPSTGIYQNGFWVGKNLLGMYQWADADSDNIADGWDASEFSSTSFGSGQQTLTTDGAAVDIFFRDLWLPFDGEELTFSIQVDTYNAIDSLDIEIVEYDTSDSVIATTSTAISSTGRKSVTKTLSSGSSLSYVRCQVTFDNTTTGTSVSEVVSDPTLRIGTATTYTIF